MSKKRSTKAFTKTKVSEGLFIKESKKKDSFKVTTIDEFKVRIWGASGRGLAREEISSLKSILKRVEPEKPIALMADYHPGAYGLIGSVIPSEQFLIPDLIGNDCGCGIYAARLGIDKHKLNEALLRKILKNANNAIPLGSEQNTSVSTRVKTLPVLKALEEIEFLKKHHIKKLHHQLGTLGGGNHFIELAYDEENIIWLLIHSGSRYLGGLLKDHYLNQDIPLGSPESHSFMKYHEIVLNFAKESRFEMAHRMIDVIESTAGVNCTPTKVIDLAHNFIDIALIDRKPFAVHRKGAAAAKEGISGVIPGSMASGSYIIEGRGNPLSYHSSSHGAGRAYSRKAAFKSLSSKDFMNDMKGIIWSESIKLKDESPRAYKDIHKVMQSQRDLVRIRHYLKPILSIKGER